MDIRQLTRDISVCGQINPTDVADIAKLGFKTIINNRPDGEGPLQPLAKTIEDHAQQAGLAYHHLPVISGAITRENVDDFADILKEVAGPVLLFCRSGARCANLWSLANGAAQ